MKRRELLAGLGAALLAGGCAKQAPAWVRQSRARYTRQVALPQPATAGSVSLEQCIQQRRSRRTFRPDPLPAAAIGQLLWAGQGITSLDGEAGAGQPAITTAGRYLVTGSARTDAGEVRAFSFFVKVIQA